jgi:hypothetical protein
MLSGMLVLRFGNHSGWMGRNILLLYNGCKVSCKEGDLQEAKKVGEVMGMYKVTLTDKPEIEISIDVNTKDLVFNLLWCELNILPHEIETIKLQE